MLKPKYTKFLAPVLSLVVVLTAWQAVTSLFDVPSYIVPSPAEIAAAISTAGPQMSWNYLITLNEAFLGLLLGSFLGFLIGLAMAQSTLFRKMSLPYLIGSNAIPVVAIAPILIIWAGHGLMAKVLVAAFISFFPIALNTYRGLTEFRPYFQELFDLYGASRTEFLLKYKLGNAVPYIFTGLRLNATLSVIGAIVGEFVASDRGLGYGILQASYTFNSPKLWAYILFSCSIGLLLYGAVVLTERLVLNKHFPNSAK